MKIMINPLLRKKLVILAKKLITTDDPSHDFNHSFNVLRNTEIIAEKEGGEMLILTPAALFHDLINIPKDHPNSKNATRESAKKTIDLLQAYPEYHDKQLQKKIYEAIDCCSFNNRKSTVLLEAKILQDADALESTGAISIMRTFASVGMMKAKLFNINDPFCEKRSPSSLKYGLDLFFSRLLLVEDKMNTATAKKIAKKRTDFLKVFLDQLRDELPLEAFFEIES